MQKSKSELSVVKFFMSRELLNDSGHIALRGIDLKCVKSIENDFSFKII